MFPSNVINRKTIMRYFILLSVLLSFQVHAQSARKLNKALQQEYLKLILDYYYKFDRFDSILQVGTLESKLYIESASEAFLTQSKLKECQREALKKYDQLKDLEATKEITFSLESIVNFQVPNLLFKELTESNEKYRVTRLERKRYSYFLESKRIKDQNREYTSLIERLKNDTTVLASSIKNVFFARELMSRYVVIYDSMANVLNNDFVEMEKKLQVLNRIYKQAEERYQKNGPKGFNDYYASYFPNAFTLSKPVLPANPDYRPVNNVAQEGVAYEPSPRELKEIYEVVDVPAEFPGGINEMRRFIKEHTVYPETAREKGAQGKCYVQFVVFENGQISNVVVKFGVPDCPECDKEVIRMVRSMPDWKPGEIAGKPVNSYYLIQVPFTLSY